MAFPFDRNDDFVVLDLNGRIVGRNDFVAEDNEIYIVSYARPDRGYVLLRGNEPIGYQQHGEIIPIEKDPEAGGAVPGAIEAGSAAAEGDRDGEEGGGGGVGGAVPGAIEAGDAAAEGDRDGEKEGGGGAANAGILGIGAGSGVVDDNFGIGIGSGIEDEISGDGDGDGDGDGGEANILRIGAEAAERVLEEVQRVMFLYI